MTQNISFLLITCAVAVYLRRLPASANQADPPQEQPHDHHRPAARSLGLDSASAQRPPDQRSDHLPVRPQAPILTRITPEILARAKQALITRGYIITRIKTGSASLAVTDPDAVIAWAVSRSRRGHVQRLSTHELVALAAQAACEAHDITD